MRRRPGLGLLLAASPLVLGLRGSPPEREVSLLAATLRDLYTEPRDPWERWRRRQRPVTFPDGSRRTRDTAYRDLPEFVGAASRLLASSAGDDAPLGAWLLGTAARTGEAEAALLAALGHPDHRAAFEAARSLGALGGPPSLAALDQGRRSGPPEVRAAAAWAAERIAERHGLSRAVAPSGRRLGNGFRRGVCWWRSEAGGDAGRASFRSLASLGVDWVSIHTWDPQQRGLHAPEFVEPDRRHVLRGLEEIVRNAHAAGLKVVLKPHLEMSRYRPTPEEVRALRGPDEAARRRLLARLWSRPDMRPEVWHNAIEMRSEEDWRRWFRSYERYILEYAAQARRAGADMFCVGRELDATAIRREGDWRRLIARIREVFPGPLVYSANFDGYARINFWDALDFIGVSAYFPLSSREDPGLSDLQAGWDRSLVPLEDLSRRFGRRVLFTEVGYPAVGGAARAPWRERRAPAEPWLQARCYDAAFRAVAARPWIEGAFWWLWEGASQPSFRDPSYSIQGKPASFVMARWYRGWE